MIVALATRYFFYVLVFTRHVSHQWPDIFRHSETHGQGRAGEQCFPGRGHLPHQTARMAVTDEKCVEYV